MIPITGSEVPFEAIAISNSILTSLDVQFSNLFSFRAETETNMLIRKTSSKKRQTYTYKFDDGENIKSYILESGKDGVTKEHIKLLHSLDDAEIYNNLKNVHPAQEEWQKDSIQKWKLSFEEHFSSATGRLPSIEEVNSALDEYNVGTWNASLDEIIDGNSSTDGVGDKNTLLAENDTTTEQCLPSIERLHEIIASFTSLWQEIYHEFYILEFSKTEIAINHGFSEAYVRKLIKKIESAIASDEELISLL